MKEETYAKLREIRDLLKQTRAMLAPPVRPVTRRTPRRTENVVFIMHDRVPGMCAIYCSLFKSVPRTTIMEQGNDTSR